MFTGADSSTNRIRSGADRSGEIRCRRDEEEEDEKTRRPEA